MRVECARKKNVRGSVLVKLRLVGPTEDGVRACRQDRRGTYYPECFMGRWNEGLSIPKFYLLHSY